MLFFGGEERKRLKVSDSRANALRFVPLKVKHNGIFRLRKPDGLTNIVWSNSISKLSVQSEQVGWHLTICIAEEHFKFMASE